MFKIALQQQLDSLIKDKAPVHPIMSVKRRRGSNEIKMEKEKKRRKNCVIAKKLMVIINNLFNTTWHTTRPSFVFKKKRDF